MVSCCIKIALLVVARGFSSRFAQAGIAFKLLITWDTKKSGKMEGDNTAEALVWIHEALDVSRFFLLDVSFYKRLFRLFDSSWDCLQIVNNKKEGKNGRGQHSLKVSLDT